MSVKILSFRPRKRPGRLQAMRWLAVNNLAFPSHDELEHIGNDLFFGWRFIRADDDKWYFANCFEAGITEDDMQNFKIAHA